MPSPNSHLNSSPSRGLGRIPPRPTPTPSSSLEFMHRRLNESGRPATALNEERTICTQCGGSYRANYRRQHLLSSIHKRSIRGRGSLSRENALVNGAVIRTAANNTIYDIVFAPSDETEFTRPASHSTSEEVILQEDLNTIENFFDRFQSGIKMRMDEATTRLINFKVSSSLSLTLCRVGGEDDTIESSIRSSAQPYLPGDDLDEWFVQLVSHIIIRYEEMAERGSGWTLARVNDFELSISRYTPLLAGSHISLPPSIARKKAVINVQNTDEKCFAYAIMSRELHNRRVHNLQRSVKYTTEVWNSFDFSGIRFPTPFKDVRIFEQKNSASVNLYGLETDSDGRIRGGSKRALLPNY